MSPLRYLSVCSGIEAASVAWRPLGWEPVAFAEIDAFPSAVLAHRFPDVPNLGDITNHEQWPELGPIDVLVGGTPCQSFSVAGLRQGLRDPRGNLALVYLALADRLRPRWVVWENVPGVRSSWSDEKTFAPSDRSRSILRAEGLDPYDFEEVVQTSDFDCFLSALVELEYGFAWRSLDAQYDGLAQRRERVFVVGRLGDWRPAAAVLFESQSLRWDSAPSREAGEGVAGGVASSLGGGSGSRGWCNDLDRNGAFIPAAFGGNKTSGDRDTAAALTAKGGCGRMDFESETFVCGPLNAGCHGHGMTTGQDAQSGQIVAHALRAEGFDGSGDGTGRGTPLVAFSCKDHGADAGELAPTLRGMGHEGGHANAGGQVVVAFSPQSGGDMRGLDLRDTEQLQRHQVEAVAIAIRGRGDGRNLEYRDDGTANAIMTPNGGRDGIGVGAVMTRMQVRRLTPRECERLQGFPDDWTKIPWRGKDAEACPDGPRYKALGNSMAVPVVRWIGERIAMVEEIVLAETPRVIGVR